MYRIFFLLLLSINLQSQFSIEPSPTEGFANASVAFFNADSNIFNNTDSTINFAWKRITNDLPNDWTSGICTNLGCLPPEVDEGTFFLESGFSIEFNCTFFPNDIAGNAKVEVNIWIKNDSTQMIQQTYFAYADPTYIVVTDIKNPISLFPNPVNETFSLHNNDKIRRVEIYNSLGQKVKTYSAQLTYNIQFLPTDIYFVKIFNKKNEVLAVLKMAKG